MSQPCDPNCNVEQPGELDEELGEFWVGNPWEIFETKNLSCYERNRLYLNAGDRRFVDVSYASATDSDAPSTIRTCTARDSRRARDRFRVR